MDPEFFGIKVKEEQRLRASGCGRPEARRIRIGVGRHRADPGGARAAFRATRSDERVSPVGPVRLCNHAGAGAAERAKPNGERLPEYTDQGLVRVQQRISAPDPRLQGPGGARASRGCSRPYGANLGADDPFVRKVLGKESPEQLAHRLVTGTHLDDAKVREALYTRRCRRRSRRRPIR